MPHKDIYHPGRHSPIVDREVFDAVQVLHLQNAGPKRRIKAGLQPLMPKAPLTGLLFDDLGNLMSPVTARGKAGQRYRYYVSSAVQLGRAGEAGSVSRCPAPALEALVIEQSQALGMPIADGDLWADLRAALVSVELERRRVRIIYLAAMVPMGAAERLPPGEAMLVFEGDHVVLTIAATVRLRGGAKVITGPRGRSAITRVERDPVLIKALARAEAWRRRLIEGRSPTIRAIGEVEGLAESQVQRLLRLAFLAPDLKRAILNGRQPAGLTLERFKTHDLPLEWRAQRQLFTSRTARH